MKNEWTRDDLPHQHEVWDDFVAGKHSDVFHAVDADDLGEVLDEIVDHLNTHHPKSQPCDCGETIDALNRNRDALVENRDQSISSLRHLLATAEADRDHWRRAHEIVEAERDQARRERDEWKQEHDLLVVHGSVRGDTYAAMVRDRDDWRDKAYNASEGMRKAVARAEAAEARTAVTREDVEKVVHGSGGGFFDSRLDAIADAVCDLLGVEAGQVTDPVEELAGQIETATRTAPAVARADIEKAIGELRTFPRFLTDELLVLRDEAIDAAWVLVSGDDPAESKARELWEIGRGMSVHIEFDDIAPDHRGEYLRIARHLLGQTS